MPTGGVSVTNVAEWFVAGVFRMDPGRESDPPTWAKKSHFPDFKHREAEFIQAVQIARIR